MHLRGQYTRLGIYLNQRSVPLTCSIQLLSEILSRGLLFHCCWIGWGLVVRVIVWLSFTGLLSSLSWSSPFIRFFIWVRDIRVPVIHRCLLERGALTLYLESAIAEVALSSELLFLDGSASLILISQINQELSFGALNHGGRALEASRA